MTGERFLLGWGIGAAIFVTITLVAISVAVHRGEKGIDDWGFPWVTVSVLWPFALGIATLILAVWLPVYGAHQLIGLVAKPRPAPPKDEMLEAARREVEAIAPSETP